MYAWARLIPYNLGNIPFSTAPKMPKTRANIMARRIATRYPPKILWGVGESVIAGGKGMK